MLPVLQKKIVKKCREKKKPVIIATQMLESMTNNSSPTRAEVSDVATSVYQGADAVMLSGETAVGVYPIETINMMSEIITNVESEMLTKTINKINITSDKDYRSAIGEAVKSISKHLEIDSIVVMTESGATARIVSHFRTHVNIFALSPSISICNRMALLWGVVPIATKDYLSTDEMLLNAEKILLEKKYMKKGQTFLMTAGVPVGITGSTNMIKIQRIGD
jgi:pyruvate kinase